MVASRTIALNEGDVKAKLLKSFLANDPKGELQIFHTPVAFRPFTGEAAHIRESESALTEQNVDTADQGGAVFVPVRSGEGVFLRVDFRTGHEDCRAVTGSSDAGRTAEHLLHYLPRIEDSFILNGT